MKPMTAEQECEYVSRAKSGDKHSFEHIFNRYHHALNFKICGIVRDEEKANDVTMEAFEKAFVSLHKYQPTYRFSTWLFRLATNCAIDSMRRESVTVMGNLERLSRDKSENSEIANVVFSVRDCCPTPEESICNHQRDLYVRGKINDLPLKLRQVLELRFFDNLSNDEISEILCISNSAVRAYISKAKTDLKEIIVKEGLINEIY